MFKQSEAKANKTPIKEDSKVSTKAPSSSSQAPSIIGSDVRLKGNLATSGEVQFDGAIEGDLQAGALTVGNSAEISGSIIANTVVVHGKVSGTIQAKKVRLEAGSKVMGDILHEDLSVASGAHIEGHLKRVDNATGSAARPAQPAAAQPVAPKAAE
jgi:cytoskeletal protein CcmA (bactofilin family)